MPKKERYRGLTKVTFEWMYGIASTSSKDILQVEIKKIKQYVSIQVFPNTVTKFTGLYDQTKWHELDGTERYKWVAEGYTADSWKGIEAYEGDLCIDLTSKKSGLPTMFTIVYTDNIFYAQHLHLLSEEYNFEIPEKFKIIGNVFESMFMPYGLINVTNDTLEITDTKRTIYASLYELFMHNAATQQELSYEENT